MRVIELRGECKTLKLSFVETSSLKRGLSNRTVLSCQN